MSFDPQNPRGSSSPTPPPSVPPTPSKQPSYVPPQPVNRGPSRNVLIAVGAVIGILVVGILLLLLLNALKGAPAASTSPSASAPASHAAPTSAGSQRPSLVPSSPTSSGPASSPTVRPTPGGSIVAPSAGTPEAALLAHVPDAIRASCTAGPSTDEAFVAQVNCVPSATVAVSYTQYADANGMDAAYEALFSEQQIDQDSGSCEDHATWPAEGTYDVEGQPAGRRLCADADGTATIYWTDDALLILSTANSASADADALLAFWTNEAGPLP